MHYKAFYITDDGTEFDNELDAIEYCDWQDVKILSKRTIFHDQHWNSLMFTQRSMTRDSFYANVYFIDVHIPEEVAAIHKLVEYTGWVELANIDSVGMWKWSESGRAFVK